MKAVVATLALLFFALVLARTLLQLSRAPALNWDMLPAMALALEWEDGDPAELHRRTYEAARAELAPEAFRKLTKAGVRQARHEDPAAFHEHLAFYRARVLYTFGVFVLHRCGAPLAAATWWISLGAFALGALLFLGWSARHVPVALAALFALGLAHTPALLNLATYSTADGLATLIVCLGAFCFVERKSFVAGAALLTLAIAARPDSVILIGFLAAALFVLCPREERPTWRALAIWIALSAGLYLGVQRFSGEYGWWPLMTISFDEKAVHPATLATTVDGWRYAEILGRQLAALPGNGYLVGAPRQVTGSTLVFLYAACAVLGLALWHRERARHAREAAWLAALLATYTLRFLLFPQLWDRFLAPFYALVPLCLLAMLARELAERRPPASA